MRCRANCRNVKPQLERLEDRCVPAGGVTAQLVANEFGGSVLRIVGDSEANHVHIRSLDEGRTIIVDGNSMFVGGWSPTLVNGERAVVFDANQISDIVLISGGGDDRVVIGVDVPLSRLDIDTGAGFDRVSVSGTIDAVSVNAGQDRDEVFITGGMIVGELHIDTGHGDDYVQVEFTKVAGGTVINTGNGKDFVTLFRLSLGQLAVNLGQDNDTISFEFEGSDGPHVLVAGDALLVGGQGDDAILFGGAFRVDGSLDVGGF